MNAKKQIGSCIDRLRAMLGDANNELSSEQRSNLETGIRNLKKLQRANKLTHEEIFIVVSQIAEAAFEVMISGSDE